MNVPAVFILIGALLEPGAMSPVLNAPESAVAVCVVLSLLLHATVCPTFIVIVTGAKLKLLIVTVTSAEPPVGVGVGVGPTGLLPLPQATANIATASERPTNASLIERIFVPPQLEQGKQCTHLTPARRRTYFEQIRAFRIAKENVAPRLT